MIVVEESVATATLEAEEVHRRLERCLQEHHTLLGNATTECKLIILDCQPSLHGQ